jgi:hypothetical protein
LQEIATVSRRALAAFLRVALAGVAVEAAPARATDLRGDTAVPVKGAALRHGRAGGGAPVRVCACVSVLMCVCMCTCVCMRVCAHGHGVWGPIIAIEAGPTAEGDLS